MRYLRIVSIARVLVVLVALLTPVTSMTLAYMDPSDPTWISGYWDNDDFDSAVDALLNSVAVTPASPVAQAGPCWITVARIAQLDVNAVPSPVSTIDAPRGPPAHSLAIA